MSPFMLNMAVGPVYYSVLARSQGYKNVMLNSAEHDFFLLINVKMPGAVGILIFMSRKNSGRGLSAPEENLISWYFYTYDHLKFHAELS